MINYSFLSDKELLGLVIRENYQVVEKLFEEFPTLPDLLIEADELELIKIKGIGKEKAKQIRAIYELSKRLYTGSINNNPCIGTPADVVKLMAHEIQYQKKEHFIVILLNTKNKVISIETISIGTLNASIVHPREVFQPAIKKSANSIIVVHGHPSGDPSPSKEDIEVTQRLKEAGKIMGIDLIDHIIIGNGCNRYCSLKEKGVI